MSDDQPTTGRFRFKPAAVDIIRKKNLRELTADGEALNRRMTDLRDRHDRLTRDVSALEAELTAIRTGTPKLKSAG